MKEALKYVTEASHADYTRRKRVEWALAWAEIPKISRSDLLR